MTELFIPTISNKKGTEFYRHSETFRRRSEASKAKAANYWSNPENHNRVSPTAKPVDVFDLQGHFLASFPSSRKAARHYGLPISSEHNILACCRHDPCKKSCYGFMFRFHAESQGHDIEPYHVTPPSIRRYKRGYHWDHSYLCKPVRVVYPDGDAIDFPSVNDTAAALHCGHNTVSMYLHSGKPYKGKLLQFIEKQ